MSPNDEEEYEVEQILAKGSYLLPDGSHATFYFVSWVGGELTWEPEENLTGCDELLKEFKKRESANVKTPTKISPKQPAAPIPPTQVENSPKIVFPLNKANFYLSNVSSPERPVEKPSSGTKRSPVTRSRARNEKFVLKFKKEVFEELNSDHDEPDYSSSDDSSDSMTSKRKRSKKSDKKRKRSGRHANNVNYNEKLESDVEAASDVENFDRMEKRRLQKLRRAELEVELRAADLSHMLICFVCKESVAVFSNKKKLGYVLDDSVATSCFRCHRGVHTKCLDKTKLQTKYWKCDPCTQYYLKVDKVLGWKESSESCSNLPKNAAKACAKICATDAVCLVTFCDRPFREGTWVPAAWADAINHFKFVNCLKQHYGPISSPSEVIKAEWMEIDRVLQVKRCDKSVDDDWKWSGTEDFSKYQVLIKWKGLPYESSTWEKISSSDQKYFAQFELAFLNYKRTLEISSKDASKFKSKRFPWNSVRNNEYVCPMRPVSESFVSGGGIQMIFHELVKQPHFVCGGQLKPYQIEGVNWMLYNYSKNVSSILGDDMGLGKTIQIIALTSILLNEYDQWPVLIVVPNATLSNWEREYEKWSPSTRVVTYWGTQEARELIQEFDIFHPKSHKSEGDIRCHVVVTTYEILIRDTAVLTKVKWKLLVVDEAHRLKNDGSRLHLELRKFKTKQRICLTGTPLQNNVRELFNLLGFLDPNIFGDPETLDNKFKNLTKENVEELHELLRPHLLRRTKDDVLKEEIPPKAEVLVPVSMTPLQRELYKAALSKNFELLKNLQSGNTIGLSASGRRKSYTNILMELRKILAHPYLIDGVEPMIPDEKQAMTKLVLASGKFILLEKLLKKLRAKGHRVLLFSQFTRVLDVIEDYFCAEDIHYERIDGSVNSAEKQKVLDRFCAEDSKSFVFLLSTRAGGQGINLWKSDTVILYDQDFNPHQDLQALSRCHRLGQTKTVLVIRLFTKNTAEERILEIAKKKLVLDHLIVNNLKRKFEPEEFQSILEFGALQLFTEKKEDAEKRTIHYDDAAIDAILDRDTHYSLTIDPNSNQEVGKKAFGFAKIWESKEESTEREEVKSDFFWENLMEKRIESAKNQSEVAFGRGQRKRPKIQYFVDVDEGMEMSQVEDGDFNLEAGSSQSDSDEEVEEEGVVLQPETLQFKSSAGAGYKLKNPSASTGANGTGKKSALTKTLEDDYIRNLQQQIYLLELESRYLRAPRQAIGGSFAEDIGDMPSGAGGGMNENVKNLKYKYVELQESAKKEAKKLEDRIEQLKSENEQNILTIATLEKERDDLLDQIKSFKDHSIAEKDKIYGEVLTLRKKLELAQADASRMELSVKRLTSEKQMLQNNFVNSQEETTKYRDQVEEQLQINANLKQKLDELYKANGTLKSRLEEAESSLLSFDLETLQTQVRDLQNDKISLQAEIKQAEAQKNQEEHLRIRISQDFAEIVKANVTLKSELEDTQRRMRREFEGREEKVKKRQDHIKDSELLREDIARLKDEITMNKIALDNKERKVNELTQQSRQMEIALHKALEGRTLYEERIIELESRLRAQEQEVIQLAQDKNLLIDDVAELRNASEIRQKKVQQLLKEKQDIKNELEKFQGETDARNDFAQLIQQLENSGENYLGLMRNMRSMLQTK